MARLNDCCTNRQGGMALLEGLLAVLVFSIGILAIVGLQATALGSVADAEYRASASLAANQIIGRMWTDQGNIPSYATSNSAITTNDSELLSRPALKGKKTIVVVAQGSGYDVTITISWTPPKSSQTHKFETQTRIYLS